LAMCSQMLLSYYNSDDVYSRQLSGDLTVKEAQLQRLNLQLGLSESNLLSQAELNSKLNSDLTESNKEFDEFIKEHDLQIASRDIAIAKLKQKLSGSGTAVIVTQDNLICENIESCTISYNWQDTLSRFKLSDPNIWESGDEVFESEQIFKIYGEVYQQKDGQLQTRRLVLREVIQKPDGTYEAIPNAKAELVDSKFDYFNPPRLELGDSDHKLFNPRVMALGSFGVIPSDIDVTLGLGIELLTFHGIGLGTYTLLDFNEPGNIAQHVSLSYNPTFRGTELNFGAFISLSPPFANFSGKLQLNTGLVFYLNN